MSKKIESISIIGSGNVAHHLGKAFAGHVKIVSLCSRNHETGSRLAEELDAFFVESIEEVLPSDLVLICVNDDAIASVLDRLPIEMACAYCSGAIDISTLPSRDSLGVFYPLQTFSANRTVDLFEVPFFIEANNEYLAQALFDMAWLLSRKVVFANSIDRKNLHLAAVMVNNFVNHIDFLAEQFLISKSLEFDYLKPLIKETAMKVQSIRPFDAQTGPAMREDQITIDSHLSLLDDETKEIYNLLTKSILKHHNPHE